MIYQHWIGTLIPTPVAAAAANPACCPVDLWLPVPAPTRASRFERDCWPSVAPPEPLAAGGSFIGTVEYWYGDEEEQI